jgi:hypothetical protein
MQSRCNLKVPSMIGSLTLQENDMLSLAKLTFDGLLENQQKLLNFRRLEAANESYLNLRWLGWADKTKGI